MIPDNFYFFERKFKNKYKSIIEFFMNNIVNTIYLTDVNKVIGTNSLYDDYDYFDGETSKFIFDFLILSNGSLYYFYEDEYLNCYSVERLSDKRIIDGCIEAEGYEDDDERFIEVETIKDINCEQVLDVVPHYENGIIDGFTLVFQKYNLSFVLNNYYTQIKINEPAQKYIPVKQNSKIYSLIESWTNEIIAKENLSQLPKIVYNGVNVGLCCKYADSTELKKLISRNYLGISYSSYVDEFELVETLMRLTMNCIWSNPEVMIFFYRNMCAEHNCSTCVIKEFCNYNK